MKHVLVIDNFDSFTFNLVDDLQQLSAHVKVVRNSITVEEISRFINEQPITHLLLSPGPGTPQSAGNLVEIISRFYGQLPILGICLGMQAMVVALGGTVAKCGEIIHGKSSQIEHHQTGIFKNITHPMIVGRYHSLAATKIPQSLTITASYQQIVMAVENKQEHFYGVQFHPESILTPDGKQLLQNFLEIEDEVVELIEQ